MANRGNYDKTGESVKMIGNKELTGKRGKKGDHKFHVIVIIEFRF